MHISFYATEVINITKVVEVTRVPYTLISVVLLQSRLHANVAASRAVSYTHLTLPTTPYV